MMVATVQHHLFMILSLNLVGNPRHIRIPTKCNDIGCQNLEMLWHKSEIDELERDPENPVGFHNCEQVILYLGWDLFSLTLHRHYQGNDASNENRGEKQLIHC